MLELIRKHQYGIMVLVAVIVIFAFAWWGDFFGRGEQNPGRGQPFISFGGKTYTLSQISKVASGSQLAQRYFPFHVFQVERAYRRYEMQGLDYALNTLALRKHAVDYGIAVSPEDIDKRMLSMPDFQTPEARERVYRLFGSLGLGEADVAQIVADVITMEKLSDLVSAGLLASDAGAEYDYASRYQTIFSSVVKIPDVNPEDVEVTEEELKELFEAQKAGLQTERQVAIRYVFFEAPSDKKTPEKPDTTPPVDGGAKPNEAGKTGKTEPPAPEKTPGEKPKTDDSDDSEGGKSGGEKKDPANGGDDPITEPEGNVKPAGEAEGTDCGDTDEGEKEGENATNLAPEPPSSEEPTEPGEPTAPTAPEEPTVPAAPTEPTQPSDPTPPTDGNAGNEKEPVVPNSESEKKGEGTKPASDDGAPPKPPGIDIPTIPNLPIPGTDEISVEEKARLRREFNALVDQFWGEFFQDGQFVPGVDFAEKAKDERYGVTMKETGMFSVTNPPEDIAKERELIAAAIFKPLDPPISDPIPATGEKRGYFIFEILKVEEPRQKTFEEAREDLEKALRRDKAAEETVAAADKAREAIAAAVESGKSFAEAAKEAGSKVEELKPFSPGEPPAEPADLRQMLPALMEVVPGEVSEIVDLFDGKALVFVSKRELWKRANAETLKDSVRSGAVSSQGFNLLGEWFAGVRSGWNEQVISRPGGGGGGGR